MRTYRGPEGDERLWFEAEEIEAIMQDELRKADLMPSEPDPGVNIEQFIEQHLKVDLDQHAPLDASVLGLTEFRRKRPPKISINEDLTGAALDDEEWGSPGLVGRWRATLAHEASHVLLHRILYDPLMLQESFFHEKKEHLELLRCLKREVSFSSPKGDWKEIQANLGMAALLMPGELFKRLFHEEAGRIGIDRAEIEPGTPEVSQLVAVLSEQFHVSRQAAAIRVESLHLLSPAGAMLLPG